MAQLEALLKFENTQNLTLLKYFMVVVIRQFELLASLKTEICFVRCGLEMKPLRSLNSFLLIEKKVSLHQLSAIILDCLRRKR